MVIKARMIKTKFQVTIPVSANLGEIETHLQKHYPGVFLLQDQYDVWTDSRIYKLCFENTRDYTFFLLKYS